MKNGWKGLNHVLLADLTRKAPTVLRHLIHNRCHLRPVFLILSLLKAFIQFRQTMSRYVLSKLVILLIRVRGDGTQDHIQVLQNVVHQRVRTWAIDDLGLNLVNFWNDLLNELWQKLVLLNKFIVDLCQSLLEYVCGELDCLRIVTLKGVSAQESTYNQVNEVLTLEEGAPPVNHFHVLLQTKGIPHARVVFKHF